MKRIQMIKAAVVVLAIGGALTTKAGKALLVTYYTISTDSNHTCQLGSSNCSGGTNLCSFTTGTPPNEVTTNYYRVKNSGGACIEPISLKE